MPDPLKTYRARLLQNTSYIPGPAFVDKLRWDNEDSGHVLVDGNTNSHLVAIVVGRVSENKLNCGPAGNYLGSDAEFANLATATNEIEKNESALEHPFLVLIVCLRVHVKQSTALL
jgi:hypothetical protein